MLKKILSFTLVIVLFCVSYVYAEELKTHTFSDNANLMKNAYSNESNNKDDFNYNIKNPSAATKSISGLDYVDALKASQFSVPAIMYHKITDNPAEVTDYIITGKMLEDDFAEMKARGYTPITVSDYYRMVRLNEKMMKGGSTKEMAEFFRENPKPIIITFDDGYEGIYTHVLPLMKKYGFKVNFYICGELIDNNHPEYCTWDEIKTIVQSGLAEIGNHTYSLHEKTKEELLNLYNTNFDTAIKDINKNREIIAKHTGINTTVFSFPYGAYTDITINMLRAYGYSAFVSTDYRINRISENNPTLGRFNRPASDTTKHFFDIIEAKIK